MCTHTHWHQGKIEKDQSPEYSKIFRKTQYLMNTLYMRSVPLIPCSLNRSRHMSLSHYNVISVYTLCCTYFFEEDMYVIDVVRTKIMGPRIILLTCRWVDTGPGRRPWWGRPWPWRGWSARRAGQTETGGRWRCSWKEGLVRSRLFLEGRVSEK